MRISCPFCGHENIHGDDICEQCKHSLHDLEVHPATAVEAALLSDQIARIDPKRPITVDGETPLHQALKLLVDNSIGCVLVVREGQLVGILTERDVILKVGADIERLRDRPVRDFMTRSPVSLTSHDKVAFAVQRMDQGGYRHVPIVDEDHSATGVISVRDILRYLTDLMGGASGR